MRGEIEQTFDDYLAAAEGNTREVLTQNGPVIDAMRETSTFFEKEVWSGDFEMPPSSALLSMNAYMLLLAGMRTALSGHAAAVFPLLRTSLESACYAFLISQRPDLEDTWMNRHNSRSARDRCRKSFAKAVGFTTDSLSAELEGSGEIVAFLYDALIDEGAHPNPRSVFRRTRWVEDYQEGFQALNLAGLHSADSIEHLRGMFACLDVGLITAAICANCRAEIPAGLQDGIDRLNELKETVTAPYLSEDK